MLTEFVSQIVSSSAHTLIRLQPKQKYELDDNQTSFFPPRQRQVESFPPIFPQNIRKPNFEGFIDRIKPDEANNATFSISRKYFGCEASSSTKR